MVNFWQFVFKNKNPTEVRSLKRFFYLFVSAFGTFSFIHSFFSLFPFFLSKAFFYLIHFHHPLPSHYLFYEIYLRTLGTGKQPQYLYLRRRGVKGGLITDKYELICFSSKTAGLPESKGIQIYLFCRSLPFFHFFPAFFMDFE